MLTVKLITPPKYHSKVAPEIHYTKPWSLRKGDSINLSGISFTISSFHHEIAHDNQTVLVTLVESGLASLHRFDVLPAISPAPRFRLPSPEPATAATEATPDELLPIINNKQDGPINAYLLARRNIVKEGRLEWLGNRMKLGIKEFLLLKRSSRKQMMKSTALTAISFIPSAITTAAPMLAPAAMLIQLMTDQLTTYVKDQMTAANERKRANGTLQPTEDMEDALQFRLEDTAKDLAYAYYGILAAYGELMLLPDPQDNKFTSAADRDKYADALHKISIEHEKYYPQFKFLHTYVKTMHKDMQLILEGVNYKISKFHRTLNQ